MMSLETFSRPRSLRYRITALVLSATWLATASAWSADKVTPTFEVSIQASNGMVRLPDGQSVGIDDLSKALVPAWKVFAAQNHFKKRGISGPVLTIRADPATTAAQLRKVHDSAAIIGIELAQLIVGQKTPAAVNRNFPLKIQLLRETKGPAFHQREMVLIQIIANSNGTAAQYKIGNAPLVPADASNLNEVEKLVRLHANKSRLAGQDDPDFVVLGNATLHCVELEKVIRTCLYTTDEMGHVVPLARRVLIAEPIQKPQENISQKLERSIVPSSALAPATTPLKPTIVSTPKLREVFGPAGGETPKLPALKIPPM